MTAALGHRRRLGAEPVERRPNSGGWVENASVVRFFAIIFVWLAIVCVVVIAG